MLEFIVFLDELEVKVNVFDEVEATGCEPLIVTA
jgi:hypothetical protein